MSSVVTVAETLQPKQNGASASASPSFVPEKGITLYRSSTDLPEAVWRFLNNIDKKFLCQGYLHSLENSKKEELELRYAVFSDEEGKLMGVSAFQITHFTTSDDAYSNKFIRFINQLTRFIRHGHIHNILICGNAFATGEHGYYFTAKTSAKQIAQALVHAMRMIAKNEKDSGKSICAMLVKDFYPGSEAVSTELSGYNFKSFQVDHNMVMPIDPNWNTFDDYLTDLNTKFRTKAKAAIKRAAPLEAFYPTKGYLTDHLPRFMELYNAVHERADFRLGKLDLHVLPEMLATKEANNFVIRCYKLGDQLVGFATAMICGNTLEAHIIGIDYTHNKEYAVYQNMLYDYIKIAIEHKCTRVVFGRTAAEIKSSIGAFPVHLTCSIHHPKKISNALLSLILQYIKPSDYPHRDPYKAEVLARIKNMKLY